MEAIADRLDRVRNQIAQAAAKAFRSVDTIELLAASKKQDADKIRAAEEAGQLLFGESRVQEARAKIPLLPSRLRWHFIGTLQKNKIRHALPFFELFHAVDSLPLAQEINRVAGEEGMRPRVLLQVNVAHEASKHGFSPEALRRDLEPALSLGRLSIDGLMTIPPLAPDPEGSRCYFVALRELRDQLENEFSVKLPQLSMGMSGDFPIAIEEGATLVRVGSAIFGERSRAKHD
jgi:pyridoxal phosphate enzyme (YggS family)